MNSSAHHPWVPGGPLAQLVVGLLFAAATALPTFSAEIGSVSWDLVDPARGDRPVPAAVYYPALTTGPAAPVAEPPADGFPVVLVGHAYLTPWDRYAYLWADLVPAGYVLGLACTENEFTGDQKAFAQDLILVHAAIAAANTDPESPFYGKISDRWALVGHSFGGASALRAARRGPPCDALALLAPLNAGTPTPASLADEVVTPTLILAASLDCVTPPAEHQEPIFANLAAPRRILASLLGGSHCQFAAPEPDCHQAEAWCQPAELTSPHQQSITVQLLRPWLDLHLRSDDAAGALLRERLDGLPEVTYTLEGPLPTFRKSWGDLKRAFR